MSSWLPHSEAFNGPCQQSKLWGYRLKHWLTLVPDTRAAQRVLISDIANLAGNIEKEADVLLLEFSDAGIQHPILKAVRGVIAIRAAHLLRIIDGQTGTQ